MDLFKLAQESDRLIDAIDSALWDASIAQDKEYYQRLLRVWDMAQRRHERRYNEYQKIREQPTVQ